MKKSLQAKDLIMTKPMKIKIRKMIDSIPALQEIGKLKLPIASSYKVSKVLKAIDSELNEFDKIKNKRIEELGEERKDDKDEPNGLFKVKDENLKKYNDEFKELIDKEVEIDIPEISVKDLEDCKIEGNVLATLDWLIK